MKSARILIPAPIALAALLGAASRLSACPLCKETVGENSAGLGEGFNTSIYLMLGMVGLLGAYIIRRLVREARAADLRSSASGTPEPHEPSAAPRARSR